MQKTMLLLGITLLAIFITPDDHALMRLRSHAAARPTEPQTAWETYTFTGEEFSVALPEMPALDHTGRDVVGEKWGEKARNYGAYGDGVVYLIRAYDKPRNGEDIDHFARYFMNSHIYPGRTFQLQPVQAIQIGKFHGKQYTIVGDTKLLSIPGSSIQVFLTEKHAYALRAYGGDDNHPGVQRFFNSFVLTDKPAGRQIVDDWKLPRPAVVRAIKVTVTKTESGSPSKDKESDENRGVSGGDAAAGGISKGTEETYSAKEVTRKASIVWKSEPHYTEKARKNEVTGTVRLRVLLSASGKVTNLVALTLLPDGLTENAILVASHIKFIPAMKDGRRVSQYVQIEYNFNIY